MIEERAFELSIPQPAKDIFFQLEDQTRAELFDYETPMRFVVSSFLRKESRQCEQ